MPIVLASASPRRQELLKNAGIEFVVNPANIPERRREREAPQVFAERMAKEKARAVWTGTKEDDEYVIGADTIVVVDDLVLGKPEDEKDAARMLRLLSGRKHQVITGVCLKGSDFEDVRSETTSVHFSALNDADIRDYIATGEPMDKAGAYAIQGIASRWISKIEGDYSNVVGLPVALVLQMLRERPAIGA
jgi:septum formation protein